MAGSKKIVLDTNFLLIPGQFGVDIFTELKRILNFNYGLFIIEKSIAELENIIQKQKSGDKKAARLALSFIKPQSIKTLPLNTNENDSVDDLIVENSDEDTIVATQDAGLKRRLREKGIPIITLRQKRYL